MTDNERNLHVFTVLDEIRREVGLVRTDVAVLAAAQPRLTDIVEDHERRIRSNEAETQLRAAMSEELRRHDAEIKDLQKGLGDVRKSQDENSWLPKLTWVGVTAVVSGLAGAAVSTYIGMLT